MNQLTTPEIYHCQDIAGRSNQYAAITSVRSEFSPIPPTMRTSWPEDQYTLLSGLLYNVFLHGQVTSSQFKTWSKIYNKFFRHHLVEGQDNPTPNSQLRIRNFMYNNKQWLHNKLVSLSAGKQAMLTGKHGCTQQPVEIYMCKRCTGQAGYEEMVKKVHARTLDLHQEGGEIDPVLTRGDDLMARQSIATHLFSQEAKATQRRFQKCTLKDKKQIQKLNAQATKNDWTLKSFDQAIDTMNAQIHHFFKELSLHTSWTFSVQGEGPTPGEAGAIQTVNISFQFCDMEEKPSFSSAYQHYGEVVLGPFAEYLHQIYSIHERQARALTSRTSSQSEDPDADGSDSEDGSDSDSEDEAEDADAGGLKEVGEKTSIALHKARDVLSSNPEDVMMLDELHTGACDAANIFGYSATLYMEAPKTPSTKETDALNTGISSTDSAFLMEAWFNKYCSIKVGLPDFDFNWSMDGGAVQQNVINANTAVLSSSVNQTVPGPLLLLPPPTVRLAQITDNIVTPKLQAGTTSILAKSKSRSPPSSKGNILDVVASMDLGIPQPSKVDLAHEVVTLPRPLSTQPAPSPWDALTPAAIGPAIEHDMDEERSARHSDDEQEFPSALADRLIDRQVIKMLALTGKENVPPKRNRWPAAFDCPQWFDDSIKELLSTPLSDEYEECANLYFALEDMPTTNTNSHLDAQHRPQLLKKWLSGLHKHKDPIFSAEEAHNFANKMTRWWHAMQLPWRQTDGDLPLP
ncbi:hypothetical protein IW262DRAFT_1299713 [Armillaria fumosa]|nr:hypothetical protein IW262DRAFT_1299713 [Armillaria fumosa]